MDPNANLKEQNDLLDSVDEFDQERIADLREALYDWLARGGFQPDWDKYTQAGIAFNKWRS